jgi:hypothetical protein
MNVFRFSACVAQLLFLSVTGGAWAQSPSTHESASTRPSFEGETAWRSLFAQAKSAFAEQRFVDAKGLLLRAAEIKMTPKIAANLAQVEVQLGEYRAAANHAAEALSSLGSNEGVEADLAVASKHVAKLMVTTTQTGARVTIDGEVVGLTPLQHAIYVDSGSHIVGVDKPGFVRSTREIRATPASDQLVAFELANEAPAAARTEPAQHDLPPVATAVVLKPVPTQFDTEPNSGSSRTILLLAGGVLTAAGLATGFVFHAKANRDERHADALSQRLGSDGCVATNGNRVAQCEQLLDDRRAQDRARNLSTAGFMAGGVALAATVVVLSWPQGKTTSAATTWRATALRVQGSLAPSASCLLLSGRF